MRLTPMQNMDFCTVIIQQYQTSLNYALPVSFSIGVHFSYSNHIYNKTSFKNNRNAENEDKMYTPETPSFTL